MSEVKQEVPSDPTKVLLDFKDALEKFKEKPAMVMCVLQELEQFKLMTYSLLKGTGIGKTVNGFRKHSGSVGELAKKLVSVWKDLTSLAINAPQPPSSMLQVDSSKKAKDSTAINKALNDRYNTATLPSKVTIKKEKTDTLVEERTQEPTDQKDSLIQSSLVANLCKEAPESEKANVTTLADDVKSVKQENVLDEISVKVESLSRNKDGVKAEKGSLSDHPSSSASTTTHLKDRKADLPSPDEHVPKRIQQKELKIKKEKKVSSTSESGKSSKPKLKQEFDDTSFDDALRGKSVKRRKKPKSKSELRKVKQEAESSSPVHNSVNESLGTQNADLESLHGSVSFSKLMLEPSAAEVFSKEPQVKEKIHVENIAPKKTLALADYRLLNTVKKEFTPDSPCLKGKIDEPTKHQKDLSGKNKVADKRIMSKDVFTGEDVKAPKVAKLDSSLSQLDVDLSEPTISLKKLQSDLNHFMDVINWKTGDDKSSETIAVKAPSKAHAEHISNNLSKDDVVSENTKSSRSNSLPKTYANNSNLKTDALLEKETSPNMPLQSAYGNSGEVAGSVRHSPNSLHSNSPIRRLSGKPEKRSPKPSVNRTKSGKLEASNTYHTISKSSATSKTSRAPSMSNRHSKTSQRSSSESDSSLLSNRDSDVSSPYVSDRESKRSHKSKSETKKFHKSSSQSSHQYQMKSGRNSYDSSREFEKSNSSHWSARDNDKSRDLKQDCSNLQDSSQRSNSSSRLHNSSRDIEMSDKSSRDADNLHRTSQDSNNSHKSHRNSERVDKSNRDSDKSHKSSRDYEKLHKSSRDCEELHKPGGDSDKLHKLSRVSDEAHKSSRDYEKSHESSRGYDKSHKSNRDAHKSHKSSRDCEKSHKSSRDYKESHKSSRDYEKSHKSSRDYEESHKSSRDCEKLHKSSRDSDKSHKSSRDSNKSSRDSNELHKSSRVSDEAHKSSRDSDKSHKSSRDSDKSHKSSRDSDKSHKSSRDSGKSHKSSRDSDKSGRASDEANKSSRDVDKAHKLSQHSDSQRKTKMDTEKSHKSSRDSDKLAKESDRHKNDKVHKDIGEKSRKRKLSEGGVDATDGSTFEALLESSHSIIQKKKKPATLEQKIAKTVAEQPLPQSYLDDLPELLTDYKPLPRASLTESRHDKVGQGTSTLSFSEIKASSRSESVYSGKRRGQSSLFSLGELCIHVLSNNIDDIGYVGGVPYTLLEPVLKKATPRQLLTIEDYNTEFTQESDPLWKEHCYRDFKGHSPDEFESWRELYLRKFEERELKLERLQSKISATQQLKSSEARKSQVAYTMASAPKPPREVRRQQAKYGTGSGSMESTARAAAIQKQEQSLRPYVSKGGGGSRDSKSTVKVISVPPLMKKARKFMKKLHR